MITCSSSTPRRRCRPRDSRGDGGRLRSVRVPRRPGPRSPGSARPRPAALQRPTTGPGGPLPRRRNRLTGVEGANRLRAGRPRDSDAILERGVVPCGLGARDTLRLEACFPLHGNDITSDRTPFEAGLGWACSLTKKSLAGVDVLRRQKAEGTVELLVPFVMEDAGIPRRGMAIVEGGEVTSGTYSPMLERGSGWATFPRASPTPERRSRSTCAGGPGPPVHLRKPIFRGRRGARWQPGRESIRPKLRYHPEHDGLHRRRRSNPRHHLVRAGFSGEIVHFEPPDVGDSVAKDESYGEVESVKAVSDLFAPVSGEVVEVNRQSSNAPEIVNEDPYGEGWLVSRFASATRRRWTCSSVRRRTRSSSRAGLLRAIISQTPDDREGDARRDRRGASRGAARRHSGRPAVAGRLALPASTGRAGADPLTWRACRAQRRRRRAELSFLGAGAYDHSSRRSSTPSSSAASSSRPTRRTSPR